MNLRYVSASFPSSRNLGSLIQHARMNRAGLTPCVKMDSARLENAMVKEASC